VRLVAENSSTVIIGAGPAGLTAGYELCKSNRPVVVLEQDTRVVGGISRTVEYNGFRFDIGGHRFFSKNREIEALWDELLGRPLETRNRLSRIYFRGKFFKYPLELADTFGNLGFSEMVACAGSYALARLKPPRTRANFEEWMVAAFGRRLFDKFFRTYTEKVWGMSCSEISADWGAQRIRGLTVSSLVRSALGMRASSEGSVKTLVDRFRYPRLGPGEVWQAAAKRMQELGGQLQMGERVTRIIHKAGRVVGVITTNGKREQLWQGGHFISTMPIAELVAALDPPPSPQVRRAARSLRYRDFLVVAMILDQRSLFPDQWIYIHEPRVHVARIQNFKNWSSAMVPDPRFTSLGLEYFCFDGDGIWSSPDERLLELARSELAMLGLADESAFVEGFVIRQPKAYPIYDRAYRANVAQVREFINRETVNLQLVGRNGMHKYNNQDHAMMTGLMAARNVTGGSYDLWRVNSDAEYLEGESSEDVGSRLVPFPAAKKSYHQPSSFPLSVSDDES
jgi:protoporphyrinogen oxidase